MFFLSYAGADREAATELTERLRRAGVSVWFHPLDGAPGDDWMKTISDQIEHTDGMLVLLGTTSPSDYQRGEIAGALNRQKLEHKQAIEDTPNAAMRQAYRVVPLCLEGVDPLRMPAFLARFEAIALPPQGGWTDDYFAALRERIGATTTATGRCPFLGLASFKEEDAPFFFGRDVEILDAIKRFGRPGDRYRWLCIDGPSGAGKSSFARAGLVPAIQRGFLDDSRDTWDVVVVRPGGEPLRNLADALARHYGAQRPELNRESLYPLLHDKPDGLRQVVRAHRNVSTNMRQFG